MEKNRPLSLALPLRQGRSCFLHLQSILYTWELSCSPGPGSQFREHPLFREDAGLRDARHPRACAPGQLPGQTMLPSSLQHGAPLSAEKREVSEDYLSPKSKRAFFFTAHSCFSHLGQGSRFNFIFVVLETEGICTLWRLSIWCWDADFHMFNTPFTTGFIIISFNPFHFLKIPVCWEFWVHCIYFFLPFPLLPPTRPVFHPPSFECRTSFSIIIIVKMLG